jgi:stringent starvation protein B
MKNDHSAMTSFKPYLIRAFHEWIVDNELTPYIDVNTKVPKTEVPEEYIKDNKITLNIAPSAVKELRLGNNLISFYARFSGVIQLVSVPVRAILAIYAKENGQGSSFNQKDEEDVHPNTTDDSHQPPPKKPILKIVE